jgi:hypothetical protein
LRTATRALVGGSDGEVYGAGQRTFSAPGTGTIEIKLTAAGRRLLKHAKKLKLTARGTFTPTGKTPVRAMKTFVLER